MMDSHCVVPFKTGRQYVFINLSCAWISFKVSDRFKLFWKVLVLVGDKLEIQSFLQIKQNLNGFFYIIERHPKKFHGLGSQLEHFIGLFVLSKEMSLDRSQTGVSYQMHTSLS